MSKYLMVAKYLGKETFNISTFKLIALALILSTVVGSGIYVSNIGLLLILKAFNIHVSASIINFIMTSTGTNYVYSTIKDLTKHI